MEFVKAIAKKYSRQYTRTLKNGEKKKYHTEQVQITIPKGEDIFEDGETVLVVKSSQIDTLKNQIDTVKEVSDEIKKLETKNRELKTSENELKSTIDNYNSTIQGFEKKVENQKEELKILNKKIEEKNIEKEKIEEKLSKTHEALKDCEEEINEKTSIETEPKKLNDENNINQELSILKRDRIIENLNRDIIGLEIDKKHLIEKLDIVKSCVDDLKNNAELIKSSQKKDFSRLEEEYGELAIKYEENKEILKETEETALYYERIAKKLKEFILNSY